MTNRPLWMLPPLALMQLLCLSATQIEKPELTGIVPGEFVVKFAEGSPLATMAASAAEVSGDSTALRAELERVLSATGLTFSPKSYTSGGELVLEIDREKLAQELAARLRGIAGVLRAEPEPEPKRIRPPSSIAVRVELGPGAPAPEQVCAVPGETSGWPLTTRRDERGVLIVLDLRRLTVSTLAKLRERSDVAYAQPNYSLSGF